MDKEISIELVHPNALRLLILHSTLLCQLIYHWHTPIVGLKYRERVNEEVNTGIGKTARASIS